MTEARQRDSWNHTAAAMALLANVNRDPKKQRVFTPADFHPLPERRTPARLPGGFEAMKALFARRRDPSSDPGG